MLDHSCQVQRHTLAERGNDCYETPPVAVEALMKVEKLPFLIWEPACGPGAIVRVLRAHGHDVLATDLIDYGCPDSFGGHDFLLAWDGAAAERAIVTNPPFKLAHEFVRHAMLMGVPQIYMLLRLAFMESERRTDILDSGKLARIHVFARRLPMMHRKDWQGPKANSGMAFAWFVWDRDHTGPTTIDRI